MHSYVASRMTDTVWQCLVLGILGSVTNLCRKISLKRGGSKPKTVPPRYLGQPSPFSHPHLLKHGEKHGVESESTNVSTPGSHREAFIFMKMWYFNCKAIYAKDNFAAQTMISHGPRSDEVWFLLLRWGDSRPEPDGVRVPQVQTGLPYRSPSRQAGTLRIL